MLTDDTLIRWFIDGASRLASHMIVYRDNFTHRFFPVYVKYEEDVPAVRRLYRGQRMYRVCLIADLWGDMDNELDLAYEWNPPPTLIR